MRSIEFIRSGAVLETEQGLPPGLSKRIERNLDRADARPKVAIISLGCKVNFSETEALAENFQMSGFALVDPDGSDSPDVFVVNTCTVTQVADRKSRQVLRRARRDNPQALVVATGCYAYTSTEQVAALPEVDLVVGKSGQERLVDLVSERLNYELNFRLVPTPWLFAGGSMDHTQANTPESHYRTRSMIKIQDGCNSGCAFCIVPTARGGPRSVGIPEVVAGVKQKLEAGYQEVVLTGVHLGKYRVPVANDQERPVRLKGLLETLLQELEIPRLRITSLEPQDYDPTLLQLWQQDRRLARHFHLALQSGSAATLARMRRGYSLEKYRQIVEQIRRELPDASITTDIIVGFPGETEAEFAESLAFAGEMGFAKIHVFPYSPRSGTPAATMPDQVIPAEKKRRGELMRQLSDQLSHRWRAQFTGQVRPVLWERNNSQDSAWSGLTDNYIRIYTRTDQNLHNKIIPITLSGLAGEGEAEGMWGEFEENI